jgi:hypothetical protein
VSFRVLGKYQLTSNVKLQRDTYLERVRAHVAIGEVSGVPDATVNPVDPWCFRGLRLGAFAGILSVQVNVAGGGQTYRTWG